MSWAYTKYISMFSLFVSLVCSRTLTIRGPLTPTVTLRSMPHYLRWTAVDTAISFDFGNVGFHPLNVFLSMMYVNSLSAD